MNVLIAGRRADGSIDPFNSVLIKNVGESTVTPQETILKAREALEAQAEALQTISQEHEKRGTELEEAAKQLESSRLVNKQLEDRIWSLEMALETQRRINADRKKLDFVSLYGSRGGLEIESLRAENAHLKATQCGGCVKTEWRRAELQREVDALRVRLDKRISDYAKLFDDYKAACGKIDRVLGAIHPGVVGRSHWGYQIIDPTPIDELFQRRVPAGRGTPCAGPACENGESDVRHQ